MQLILLLIVVGVILWFVNSHVYDMNAKKIINIIVIALLILMAVNFFGGFGPNRGFGMGPYYNRPPQRYWWCPWR
jgi:hypothetical protein